MKYFDYLLTLIYTFTNTIKKKLFKISRLYFAAQKCGGLAG
jgi:hypothetical protein